MNLKSFKALSVIFLLSVSHNMLFGQIPTGYKNPVLSGFYPDPSVCRNGDDYYMVNSSFQYFPGVPIHHSKDLINWEPIGHCLTRESQLDLKNTNFWLGIYAPTIRYNNGTYFMVTTNVPKAGQLLVSTDNPAGEWSDPLIVDHPGIDPDLFFDDNGKVYFLSAASDAIWLSEIDVKTGKLKSDTDKIWTGTGGRHLEAPHMYKKDGYYYLLIAEGGTEYGHKVTISRSRDITGPFQSNPANPILTHINSNASSNSIPGVGHAAIIQAHDGSWWVVALGFRPQSYSHHLLGRETFLAPVRWEKDEWPVVNGNGTLSENMDCCTLPQIKKTGSESIIQFDADKLGYEWNFISNPDSTRYSLSERRGYMRLKASQTGINSIGAPTFIGRRQQHINFETTSFIDFKGLGSGSEAGMAVYMDSNYNYSIYVENKAGKKFLKVMCKLGSIEHTVNEIPVKSDKLYIKITGENDFYRFLYSVDNEKYIDLGKGDTRFLSSETADGFTGVYIGLFCSAANEKKSYIDIDWFDYKQK